MNSDKGLFLDFDGTLADSLPVMKDVYYRFLEGFGEDHSDAEFESLIGPPLREVVAHLKNRHGWSAPIESLCQRYRDLIEQAYDKVPPAAGALPVLRAAAAKNWLTAVVTSNDRQLVSGWLKANDLDAWVAFIVAGEDVERGKPGPDPYLFALQKSGCHAASSIAVEDSPQGAASSVAAGLPTIALCAGPRRPSDWPAGSDFIEALDQVVARL